MTKTASTSKAVGLRRWAGRKARVALATALVAAAGLVAPALVAGLVAAPPALASTTFTVNSTADYDDPNHYDNACDTQTSGVPVCTLRAAIEQANFTPGADAIHFDIPGPGVRTIHVNSSGYGELPHITEAATIDGYTQPGSSENTLAKGTNAKLAIQLDGSAVSSSGSLGLSIGAPDVVVEGLVINRFDHGIDVEEQADKGVIEGNFLGTNPSGTKALGSPDNGFGTGVRIFDNAGLTNNTVGGHVPAARNLISGNDGFGVYLRSDGNYVSGNLIGTQRDGKSPLGNGYGGVFIQGGAGNVVGGPTPSYANTIAFNLGSGVQVAGYNGHYGAGNIILSNSMFSNVGWGIDLNNDGVTANDLGDADTGANDLQNHPLLSSATKGASGKTVVKGKLQSTPNQAYKVQFFSNPPGTDEGKKLLGSKMVTTDGAGDVSLTFATTKKVGLEQNITATATNFWTGDSSEFCAPRKVVAS